MLYIVISLLLYTIYGVTHSYIPVDSLCANMLTSNWNSSDTVIVESKLFIYPLLVCVYLNYLQYLKVQLCEVHYGALQCSAAQRRV